MKLPELIARVVQIAIETASQPIKPNLLESTLLAELILPRCLQIVITQIIESPEGLNTFKRVVELTFVNGKVTLPEGLREENIETLVFMDDVNASYIANYPTFFQLITQGLFKTSKFSCYNNQLHYVPKGQAITFYSGAKNVLAIVFPVLPSDIDDEIDIQEETIQRLINFAAGVVNGSIPLTVLGNIDIEKEDEN